MISVLNAGPLFQMLLVDYPRAPEELEIISRHRLSGGSAKARASNETTSMLLKEVLASLG